MTDVLDPDMPVESADESPVDLNETLAASEHTHSHAQQDENPSCMADEAEHMPQADHDVDRDSPLESEQDELSQPQDTVEEGDSSLDSKDSGRIQTEETDDETRSGETRSDGTQSSETQSTEIRPETASATNNEVSEAEQSENSEEDVSQFADLSAAREEFAKLGQAEMPFALVQGQVMTQLPLDLYIPPDALEVILEQFEGPLDLLLYLIRKQNLDILSVNVAEITAQYMQYVELMKTVHLELAGEYLVMAAMLAEIKSRILLPRPETEEEEESDPRAELIRRLQEYERFKKAAEDLEEVPRMGRDYHPVEIKSPEYTAERQHPDVDFKELMLAFAEVLHRADMYVEHEVQKEKLSTRERMSNILSRLQHADQFIPFNQLFTYEEGRSGVVVTFLATLELIKEQLIEIVQDELFGPIHVKAKSV